MDVGNIIYTYIYMCVLTSIIVYVIANTALKTMCAASMWTPKLKAKGITKAEKASV